MKSSKYISVVSCHAEGEAGDVIIGGIRDVASATCPTMKDKFLHFRTHYEHIRRLLLHEPRGRLELSAVLLLTPCDPRADAGFVVMASGDWSPMSGSNAICATTVLLETGMVPMQEPVTEVLLDTAAGLVKAVARCKQGKCRSVAIDNVAAFVYGLDLPVDVPGVGSVTVDIAFGGRWYAFLDVASLGGSGLSIATENAAQLLLLGQKILGAVTQKYSPVHPDIPEFCGVDYLGITEPLQQDEQGGPLKTAKQAMVIKPGRLDRSPCGTGSSARLAVLRARGQIACGESVRFQSMIGTEFIGTVRGETKVGVDQDAVLPTIEGRGWIIGYKQVVLDPTDPFQSGYRLT